jgi:quercetin dioxygenase-like cupin family protein
MILAVNEDELAWSSYNDTIRYKALTDGQGVPGVGYIEYAAGHSDSMHSHKVDELFLITAGDMWLGESRYGPGSLVFIPAQTEYAVRAGDDGVRYFRVVTT